MAKKEFPFSEQDLAEPSALPKYVRLYRTRKDFVRSPAGQAQKRPGGLELCRFFGISRNAREWLTMYALNPKGERVGKIPRVKRDSVWNIQLDTARLSKKPAVFFEILSE